MISSEVQRTLVKSPPELWAELSDPDALARHLGELGEIRITRSEPEKRVEWEAAGTSGSVLIKPSGWGTKVTLSVTRELALAPAEEEPETETPSEEADSDGEAPAENAAAEIASTPPAGSEADPPGPTVEAEATVEGDLTLEAAATVSPEAEPRRGFFARLFGRRQRNLAPAQEPASTAGPAAESHSAREGQPIAEMATEETFPTPETQQAGTAIESLQARFQAERPAEEQLEAESPAPEAEEPGEAAPQTEAENAPPVSASEAEQPEESTESARDIAMELEAAEEVAAEEITAVLTAALDRLGAAHHRPFSRA